MKLNFNAAGKFLTVIWLVVMAFAVPAQAEDNGDKSDKLAAGLKLYELQQYPQAAKILIPLADGGELRTVAPVLFMYNAGYVEINSVFEPANTQTIQIAYASEKLQSSLKINELLKIWQPQIEEKANHGEAWAEFALAQIYALSNDSPEELIAWLRKAADHGNSKAQIELGLATLAGKNGVEQNPVAALDLYLAAARQGDVAGMWQVGGYLLDSDPSREIDGLNALGWLQKAADAGHISANFRLAAYFATAGKNYNPTISLKIYQKLIEMKAMVAYQALGDLFANGLVDKNFQTVVGDPDDRTKMASGKYALRYYILGAENGDIGCYSKLALAYLNGKITRVDYRKSADWYEKLADLGEVSAMSMMAKLYQAGVLGMDKRVKAIAWLEKAAAKNDMAAYYQLGQIYDQGDIVTADYVKSARYFKRVAEKGLSDAQYEYGKIVSNGDVGHQDLVEGLMWIKVSLSGTFTDGNNLTSAQKSHNELAVQLSPEDQNLARTLALKCIANEFKKCGRNSLTPANANAGPNANLNLDNPAAKPIIPDSIDRNLDATGK
ncbi:MAG: hypothetical protein QM537_01075 [Candidatus Symbiobacter sp.]|nr:hypothetical protein [Candidatus Symbiobacter sp.]